MAITEAFTNSQTVNGTEWSLPNDSSTLTPITDDGIYQVFIDTSAMTAADIYEVRIYEKVLSGGTQRRLTLATLSGVQDGPYVSPSLVLLHGWDVTLKKVSGTDRNFDWSIRKVA